MTTDAEGREITTNEKTKRKEKRAEEERRICIRMKKMEE